MSLGDLIKRRFARPPEPVRVAVLASDDPDERVLAWGALAREGGWLVATSRGLRIVPPQVTSVADAEVLPWHEVAAHCDRGTARAQLTALAVEPLRAVGEADSHYVSAVMARLQEMATVRRVAALKGKLQRMNPVEAPEEYTKVFGQLVALE